MGLALEEVRLHRNIFTDQTQVQTTKKLVTGVSKSRVIEYIIMRNAFSTKLCLYTVYMVQNTAEAHYWMFDVE